MNTMNLIGTLLACGLMLYLLCALLFPERFS
jgi:K+-transporting ATPase KdpF subunit